MSESPMDTLEIESTEGPLRAHPMLRTMMWPRSMGIPDPSPTEPLSDALQKLCIESRFERLFWKPSLRSAQPLLGVLLGYRPKQ